MPLGNGAARRWALVATIVAILAALPALVAAWPAADDDRSTTDLRAAALASVTQQFSGFAESSGGLALPAADQLSSLADLFSDRTEMRVWWRDAADNRVDVVTTGGETGYYRDATGTWTWEYEANRATRTDDAPLALPTPPDLLPNTLAIRLLSEAEPGELSRISADRIAGRNALGLVSHGLRPAVGTENYCGSVTVSNGYGAGWCNCVWCCLCWWEHTLGVCSGRPRSAYGAVSLWASLEVEGTVRLSAGIVDCCR